jgi:menaquinone-dependent protoporphyrinogen oxidase
LPAGFRFHPDPFVPEGNRQKLQAAFDPVLQLITPVSTALFPDKLDPKALSFPLRMMLKVMKTPEGDYRNWDAIRSWAKSLGAGSG